MFGKMKWILAVLATFAVGMIWLMLQPLAAIGRMSAEGAGIETASALGFALCALAVWTRAGTSGITRALISVLMLTLTSRELDMDKRFFTRGLFKSTQYLKDDVPLAEKLLSGGILLLILGCFLGLLYRERHALRAGLREWHSGIVALGVTAVLAIVAKSLDGIARKLEPFGITVTDSLIVRLEGAEEVMELTIMALLLVAILAPWHRGDRG